MRWEETTPQPPLRIAGHGVNPAPSVVNSAAALWPVDEDIPQGMIFDVTIRYCRRAPAAAARSPSCSVWWQHFLLLGLPDEGDGIMRYPPALLSGGYQLRIPVEMGEAMPGKGRRPCHRSRRLHGLHR